MQADLALDAPFVHRPSLAAQRERVASIMRRGDWVTLDDLAAAIDAPVQSISARVRDLRKPRYGSYTIARRHLGRRVFAYRMVC